MYSEGPWSIDGTDIRDANGEMISCAYALNMPDGSLERTETTYANANLIAAAPDLLEALQAICEWTKSTRCEREIGGTKHTAFLQQANIAIAKAKGV